MGSTAVDRFYQLTFSHESDFRKWTERIVEFTAALRDIIPDRPELRPVIFVPLRPASGAPIHAYVSVGARGLGVHLSGGAKVDTTLISLADLPQGLTMLYGEGIDADEYAKRHK
jgi:hypothetical protein